MYHPYIHTYNIYINNEWIQTTQPNVECLGSLNGVPCMDHDHNYNYNEIMIFMTIMLQHINLNIRQQVLLLLLLP